MYQTDKCRIEIFEGIMCSNATELCASVEVKYSDERPEEIQPQNINVSKAKFQLFEILRSSLKSTEAYENRGQIAEQKNKLTETQ